MIAAGPDLLVLQRRLGHESIKTTTETHAHRMPDQQTAAAAAAGRALGGLTLAALFVWSCRPGRIVPVCRRQSCWVETGRWAAPLR
jgi:hypothetical protein